MRNDNGGGGGGGGGGGSRGGGAVATAVVSDGSHQRKVATAVLLVRLDLRHAIAGESGHRRRRHQTTLRSDWLPAFPLPFLSSSSSSPLLLLNQLLD